MKCPSSAMDLLGIGYRRAEVDTCSACEGVWLDAGESEQVATMDKGTLDALFRVSCR